MTISEVALRETLIIGGLLVATLLLAAYKRVGLAVLALAGGVAVKLWPIVLFPLIVRPFLRKPLTLIAP